MKPTPLATLLLMALTTSANAGLYKTISIDGDFTDWTGVPSVATDPSGDSTSAVDFGDLYLANDDNYLYVRFTLHAGADPFTWQSNTFFDTDANAATGFAAVGGLVGSEMLIQGGSGYQEKNGGFNEGGVNGLGFLSAGAASQTDFEFRVSLDATYASDNLPVFAGSNLAILLQTDANPHEVLSAGVLYSLASVPEPSCFGIGAVLVLIKSLQPRRRPNRQA